MRRPVRSAFDSSPAFDGGSDGAWLLGMIIFAGRIGRLRRTVL
jgi:hypothetical protein